MTFTGVFTGYQVDTGQKVGAALPVVQSYISLNGLGPLAGGSQVNFGADASLVNIGAGDFTIDTYLRALSVDSYVGTSFLTKDDGGWIDGWAVFIDQYPDNWGLAADVSGFMGKTGTKADFYAGEVLATNAWTHLVIQWDASESTFHLAKNGVWQDINPREGSGDLGTDVGIDLRLGIDFYSVLGRICAHIDVAWLRVSSSLRWSTAASFDPQGSTPPEADAETVEIWEMNEGSGTSALAEINSGNNGVLTDCTWSNF